MDLYSSVYFNTYYVPGEWTISLDGHGPLGVFDTYQNAWNFLMDYYPYPNDRAIFSCEYYPSHHELFYDKTGEMSEYAPRGTRFASMVKIIDILKLLHGY